MQAVLWPIEFTLALATSAYWSWIADDSERRKLSSPSDRGVGSRSRLIVVVLLLSPGVLRKRSLLYCLLPNSVRGCAAMYFFVPHLSSFYYGEKEHVLVWYLHVDMYPSSSGHLSVGGMALSSEAWGIYAWYMLYIICVCCWFRLPDFRKYMIMVCTTFSKSFYLFSVPVMIKGWYSTQTRPWFDYLAAVRDRAAILQDLGKESRCCN